MERPFVILAVCTANACRSPLAERLLAEHVERAGLAHLVDVVSAGTHVSPGQPMCDHSAAHLPQGGRPHAAQPMTARLIADADLILAADRAHAAVVASHVPDCRPRLFTLREAARLAMDVEPETGRNLAGLVRAMDAARGSRAGLSDEDDDIDDDHGQPGHPATLGQVTAAVDALARVLLAHDVRT